MNVGKGKFVYEEVKGWGQLPEEMSFHEVADVAVDSKDRVYVLTRGSEPLIVLDSEGRFLSSWGKGQFTRAHSMFIGPGDIIYCVDDKGHTVRKYTPEGKRLMAIGSADRPSETGYILNRPETVLMGGPPFNRPTGLALSPEGDIYVSDGYGNARIHKFTAGGKLLFSWGEPGTGPGQFRVPHDVCVDNKGMVYVADRMNLRIQVFDPEGEFVTQWEDLRWPNSMCLDSEGNMYVAEMGGVFMDWPAVYLNMPPARITVRDLNGRTLAEIGEDKPLTTGVWFTPHGIAVDSQGNLYVGEVTLTHTHGLAPKDWSVLRKYVRL